MTGLTPRMRNWLQASGAHVGTATPDGIPAVIVLDETHIEDEHTVRFHLSPASSSR
jgi:hypothetical protein